MGGVEADLLYYAADIDAQATYDFIIIQGQFMAMAAAGVQELGLLRVKEPWYNDPLRPRDLEAGLTLLGVHVEHFARFTADQVRELVGVLGVPPEFCVKGCVPTPCLRPTNHDRPMLTSIPSTPPSPPGPDVATGAWPS